MKTKKPQFRERGFDSGYEMQVWDANQAVFDKVGDVTYHPPKVVFTMEMGWEPDLVYRVGPYTVYVEMKGNIAHFKGPQRKKLMAARDKIISDDPNAFVMMLCQHQKTLADRTKMTLTSWAQTKGFPWAVGLKIPDEWTQITYLAKLKKQRDEKGSK